jgi:DUF218 domain
MATFSLPHPRKKDKSAAKNSVGKLINATLGTLRYVERNEHRGFDYAELVRPIEKHVDVVEASGHPFGAILLLCENARYAEPLLRSGNHDVVLLVTSAYHMRRAQLVLSRLGLSVIPDAVRAEEPVIPFFQAGATPTWPGVRFTNSVTSFNRACTTGPAFIDDETRRTHAHSATR